MRLRGMKLLLSLSILFLLASCEKDELSAPCGPEVNYLQGLEDYPESDDFSLLDLELSGTCLTVEIGASGCSTDEWSLEVYSSGIATTAIPSSTGAMLVFDDGVPDGTSGCRAYLTATYSFNLMQGPTYLALIGADTTLYIE